MNKTEIENEVGAVARVISSGAGYTIAVDGLSVGRDDEHGGCFKVRRMENCGDDYYDYVECTFEETFTDYQALRAAECFVERRHEFKLGDDYPKPKEPEPPKEETLRTPPEITQSHGGCSGAVFYYQSPRGGTGA